jgi:hypothetical protein
MHVEADDWGAGPSIFAEPALAALRSALAETPLIVEHRFYRGSRAPERRVFDEFGDLEAYLRREAQPGDSVWAWRFDALCRGDNPLAHGKVPDADGRVPRRGAY